MDSHVLSFFLVLFVLAVTHAKQVRDDAVHEAGMLNDNTLPLVRYSITITADGRNIPVAWFSK